MKQITDDFFKSMTIRCSSLNKLFTQPKSAEDKKNGKLSVAATTELISIYSLKMGKVKTDTLITKYTEKGKMREKEAINLISELDGRIYTKNTERRKDKFGYIEGECDVFFHDIGKGSRIIHDTKCSFSYESFLKNLTEGINDDYYGQLQGYMNIWEADEAYLRYCLMNTPENLIQQEVKSFLYKTGLSEQDPYAQSQIEKIYASSNFDEFPIEKRVITVRIPRDESYIMQIPEKVTKAREWLREFHSKKYEFEYSKIKA